MAGTLFMNCVLEDPKNEAGIVLEKIQQNQPQQAPSRIIDFGNGITATEGDPVILKCTESSHHQLSDEIQVRFEKNGNEYFIGYLRDVDVKYIIPFHKEKNNNTQTTQLVALFETKIYRINPDFEGASGVTISVCFK